MQHTTWIELQKDEYGRKLIQLTNRPGGHKEFYFTGDGWRRAIQVSGKLLDPEFVTMLSRISKILKRSVKPEGKAESRKEEAYLYPRDVAREAGVPENFLTNVIESRLIDYQFNIQGAELEEDGMIRVPTNFGHRPL